LSAPYSLNPIEEENSFSMHEREVNVKSFTDTAVGVNEYAVWGHYKWTPTSQRSDWHLLFRLSSTDPSFYNNIHELGDRDLSVWVHNSNFIHFTTYNFNREYSNVNLYANQYFDYNEFANKWFFIYYAYSRAEGKVFYYLKFEKSEYKGEMRCIHMVPNQFHFRLA
jgi:hypothetical protein